jgi:hypothetical protein
MKTIIVPKWHKAHLKDKTYTNVGELELVLYHDLGAFAVTKNKDGEKTYAVTHKVTGIKIRDMNSKLLAKDLATELSAASVNWNNLTTPNELQDQYEVIRPILQKYKVYFDYSDTEYKARRTKV